MCAQVSEGTVLVFTNVGGSATQHANMYDGEFGTKELQVHHHITKTAPVLIVSCALMIPWFGLH